MIIVTMRICTIGGGSGMPITNQALILAGFKQITAIVTTFDSGGDTGRLRTDERGNLLAFSDYWRAIISLWQDGQQKQLWQDMLRYRDGRGRVFGNSFFRFMVEKLGDPNQADLFFARLSGAKLRGRVIPVTAQPADIVFRTISGRQYRGEHRLDELRMSTDRVAKIWLEPSVSANPRAIDALRKSEVIIVGPGSLYGSLLVNFLARGMAAAYRQSRAKKILITNLVSVANENRFYSQRDVLSIFRHYLGIQRPFDVVLMASFDRLPKRSLEHLKQLYFHEHAHLLKADYRLLPKPLLADLAVIDQKHQRLRHSPLKLAKALKKILG